MLFFSDKSSSQWDLETIHKGKRYNLNALLTRCTGTRPAFAAVTISFTLGLLRRSSVKNVCLVAASVKKAFTSAY